MFWCNNVNVVWYLMNCQTVLVYYRLKSVLLVYYQTACFHC